MMSTMASVCHKRTEQNDDNNGSSLLCLITFDALEFSVDFIQLRSLCGCKKDYPAKNYSESNFRQILFLV